MSSNRLTYDKCAYAETIKESTGSLEYNLFMGKYEKCEKCPISSFANTIPFPRLADVESELWGLTRPGTLCSSCKYQKNAQTAYVGEALSPARICESIYYITPNNLEKPKTNMLNEQKIKSLAASDYCNITNINIKEGFFECKNTTSLKGKVLADTILDCQKIGKGAIPQLAGKQISGDVSKCTNKNINTKTYKDLQTCCNTVCSKYNNEDGWLNKPCKDFCNSNENIKSINTEKDAMNHMTNYFNNDDDLKNTLKNTKIEGCNTKTKYPIDVIQVEKGNKTKKALQDPKKTTC